MPKSTGMKRTASSGRGSKSNGLLTKKMNVAKETKSTETHVNLALAMKADGADIRRGRYYRVLSDEKAKAEDTCA